MKKFFQVLEKSKKSQARLGKIQTEHGVIKTPAFVPVATKGTVKSLTPKQIKEIGVQVSFVNTYHLVTYPGVDIIEKSGGIHQMAKLDYPLMSDSGGFQVFSLAKQNHKSQTSNPQEKSCLPADRSNNKVQNVKRIANIRGEEQPLVMKISDDGVKFRSIYNGQLIEFTPEKSMEYQRKIGADLNMAFDECTYYPATHEYAEKAMERTHQWLKRCLKYNKARCRVFCPPHPKGTQAIDKKQTSSLFKHQYLYGIIQGATFEDLRKKSAKFIASQPVDGVAIGGVSVGETKKEMRNQVEWVADYLPKDKPVHLLGVGQFDDIIDLVKYGIDTFDCVEPTRLARMGTIYESGRGLSQFFSRQCSPRCAPACRQAGCLDPLNLDTRPQEIDINKNIYKNNLEPVDKNCQCWVCQNFSKAYLHHLFKQREILGYTLATYHNLFIMERFMELIRQAIEKNQL